MDILDLVSRGQDCLVSNRNKEKNHQQIKVKGDGEGLQISLTLNAEMNPPQVYMCSPSWFGKSDTVMLSLKIK